MPIHYVPITEHQERVEQFMKAAGQELPTTPILPDFYTRKLRAKLILEEALETVEALGFALYTPEGLMITKGTLNLQEEYTADLEEIIDGCCDISVVTIGTLSACGVPDQPFLEEVDSNNLAKFGPGGHRREDGKWVKPPNHKPPAIAEVLQEVKDTLQGLKDTK